MAASTHPGILATLLVVLSAAPASSQVVDVLAVSGGKRFLGFEAPLVGPNGEIAFVALNRRSRQAVYFERGGKLERY